MRSWLSLLALTIAVGALASWLYFKPREAERRTYALSSLQPSAVTHIKLIRKVAARGGETAFDEIVMEKRDGQWRMTAPFVARADEFPVGRLLSILEAHSLVRYPASDLARFGLDSPPAVMTVNDLGIAYGGINPTTREQYVMAGNQVFAVPLNYAAALPRNADALLAKALFASDESQPARFDLPAFTVALEEGTWAVAPIASDAGPDERNAWVDAWRRASALTVSRHKAPTPTESVKVTLKNGRTIKLGIAQRTPDVVLVREDEGVAYHFFADAGRRLLAPPAARTDEVKKSDEVKK